MICVHAEGDALLRRACVRWPAGLGPLPANDSFGEGKSDGTPFEQSWGHMGELL